MTVETNSKTTVTVCAVPAATPIAEPWARAQLQQSLARDGRFWLMMSLVLVLPVSVALATLFAFLDFDEPMMPWLAGAGCALMFLLFFAVGLYVYVSSRRELAVLAQTPLSLAWDTCVHKEVAAENRNSSSDDTVEYVRSYRVVCAGHGAFTVSRSEYNAIAVGEPLAIVSAPGVSTILLVRRLPRA